MDKNFKIEFINNEYLEKLRLVADPVADEVIAKIISGGFEKKIDQVFIAMVKNEGFRKDTLSHLGSDIVMILEEYIDLTQTLPEWIDQDKLKIGERIFEIYGPEIFMLLNVFSLPLCYSCAKGAQVLYDTGRLLSHGENDIDPLARRLMETAQMVVNVMSSGGLQPNGKGVVTTQKVRLIHASIRYFLKKGQYNNTPWDVSQFGEPINQEDLAGTLMSFGPIILAGLRQLNVKLSVQEQDAYIHCWKVVGYLMGINSELLPNTYTEAFELATKILARQSAPSEAGKSLTASCINFVNYIFPGNAFDGLPSYFIQFFLQEFSDASGVDLAKCVGVTSTSSQWDKLLLSFTKHVIGDVSKLEHHEFIQKISKPFNRLMLQGIINHYNGGKGVHFLIPPSLQKNWGLSNTWEDFKAITPNILGNRVVWQKSTTKID